MKRILVTISLLLTFGFGLIMYSGLISKPATDVSITLGITGALGLVLMIFSVIGGFISLVHSKTLYNSNFSKGLALCAYAGFTGFIPTLIQGFLIRGHEASSIDLQLTISMHMLFFTVIAFASAGAGGSLIAVDAVVKEEPR